MRRTLAGLFVCASASVLVLAGSAQAAAATLRVPSQYETIQSAIDAAANGDTIVVARGTYSEHIDFLRKDITVVSEEGPQVTAIDAAGFFRTAVTMHADTHESPALRGFTIRNGFAGAEDLYTGGGIKTSGGPAVIEGNIITENLFCAGGGGIEARLSKAVIRKNRIVANRQEACSGGPGGAGVYIVGIGSVQLVDNVIEGNTHGAFGGGVSLDEAGTPTIARNVIRSNTAGIQGGGMWIVNDSAPQIENNFITRNTSQAGGGIYWLVTGSQGPALVNNTIAHNIGAVGSALFVNAYVAVARIANNIIVGGSESVLECHSFGTPREPLIEFNDVLHVSGGQRYGGICSDRTGIDGNVSVDPGFKDASANDYHLSTPSPVIDRGTGTGVPTVDIDGEPRTIDGDDDGSVGTDIGADEALSPAAVLIMQLRAKVAQLPDEKVGQSLDGKLRDALNGVFAGQTTKACSKLAALISEVRAHAGDQIPIGTATEWIADATSIRGLLGC